MKRNHLYILAAVAAAVVIYLIATGGDKETKTVATPTDAGVVLTGDGAVKAISLAQMPGFDTCYAITVHKSQGSEYDKILFVLPASAEEVENNPVITRELLYTGVTRARKEVEIWCGRGVLEAAARQETIRMSGLGHQLVQ